MSDYGEPWEMDGTDIADNAGKMVCESFLSEKDQLRAISCVNACFGIEDPERVIPLLVAAVMRHGPKRIGCNCLTCNAIAALQPKETGDEQAS